VRGRRKDRAKSAAQEAASSPEGESVAASETGRDSPVAESAGPPPVSPPEDTEVAVPPTESGEIAPEAVPEPVEPPSSPAEAPEPEVVAESVVAAPVPSPAEPPAAPEPPVEAPSPQVEAPLPESLSEAVAAAVAVNEVEVAVEAISEDEPESGGEEDAEKSVSPDGQAAAGNPLPRILAVANQKGGVGKTTTSVNLGAALAELGFRVLVIDLDPQGNATTGLGIDARNFERSMYDVIMRDSSLEDCIEPTSMKNLFVAPATIDLAGAEIELVPAFSRELKLKRAIETVIEDFDYVLIDCPPSLGLITVNALAAADEVLVPIQCEYYALEGLSQLMRNVHLVASNLNAGLEVSTIVLTMYDARTKLSEQVAGEVREHFGNKVCRNIIPRTVRLSEAPSFGQPITAFDPASRGAVAYRELAKEVSGGAS
jgi:chromosome partitioning protein